MDQETTTNAMKMSFFSTRGDAHKSEGRERERVNTDRQEEWTKVGVKYHF